MLKNDEHAFKRFSRLLNEKDFPSIVLLHGKERYLVDWAYEQIINKNIDKSAKAIDLNVFEGKTVDVSELLAAIETFPVVSPKKVVVWSDFPYLEGDSSKQSSTQILDLIPKIPKNTVFVIIVNKPDKRNKLYKEIEKYGEVFDFDILNEVDLRAFIVKHFGLYGKKIEMAATEHMIKNCGYFNKESDYGLYNLENDIKKISAYSDTDTVIASDVLFVLSENLESNMFFMFDSIAAGNTERAIRVIYKMLQNGINEFQIIAMLSSQYELMLKIAELRDEGLSPYVMSKTLKEHDFRVKKAYEFARRYTKEQIAEQLTFIYSMDREIKEGHMSAALLFELFISMGPLFAERQGKI